MLDSAGSIQFPNGNFRIDLSYSSENILEQYFVWKCSNSTDAFVVNYEGNYHGAPVEWYVTFFNVGHTSFLVEIEDSVSNLHRLCQHGMCYQNLSTEKRLYEVCDNECFFCIERYCVNEKVCREHCPKCFEADNCVNVFGIIIGIFGSILLLPALLLVCICRC